MKPVLKRTFGLAFACLILCASSFAQLPKINKPKLPSAGLPKVNNNPNSAASSDQIGSGKRTPHSSGLFTNCSDYYHPAQKRDTAVKYLAKLESLLNQPTFSPTTLKDYKFKITSSLATISEHDPECDASKFEAKFGPIEQKADAQMAIYERLEAMDKQFQSDFNASAEVRKPSVLTFRTDSYGAHKNCYCGDAKGQPYSDFEALKKEYDEKLTQSKGYKNENTQKIFERMVTCQQNGNVFAQWAAQDHYIGLVEKYNAEKKDADPDLVIKRCDEFMAGLGRIESDPTLALTSESKKSLADAKAKTAKIKSDAELYISSGGHKTYMDNKHATEIATVFLPKAVAKNPTLEQSAANFLKSDEYPTWRTAEYQAVTTYKTVLVTSQPEVEKNDLGIPKYKYHEIWVSFKAKNGKCYMAPVFAKYEYMGGGVYATTPKYMPGLEKEMAAANVLK